MGVTPIPVTHLALSSGDSDPLPAVEAAKREGVVVWPVHGARECRIELRIRRMFLIAAIFVLSGFAALTYQVAWQRALFGIYGLNVESVTVVVTAFMLGLGLGSLAGGWVAARLRFDKLVVFAVAEAGVCAYGACSLGIFAWVGELTGPMGPMPLLLASFGLLLPPTLLMGATLPLLVGHGVDRLGNVGVALSNLYFANTIGGAAAAIVTGVALMRWVGLDGTVWLAAAVNAGVCLLAIALRRRRRKEPQAGETA